MIVCIKRGLVNRSVMIIFLVLISLTAFVVGDEFAVLGQDPVNVSDVFYPTGRVGDLGNVTLDTASTNDPRSKPTCIKITYSARHPREKGWAGIYWQYPQNNWGNHPDGQDLTGRTRLTFWARGKRGREIAEFKVGGITGNHPDSIQPLVSTGAIVLSNKWQQYIIDLTARNLSHVIAGFFWITKRNLNPDGCTIYLDDIQYEY